MKLSWRNWVNESGKTYHRAAGSTISTIGQSAGQSRAKGGSVTLASRSDHVPRFRPAGICFARVNNELLTAFFSFLPASSYLFCSTIKLQPLQQPSQFLFRKPICIITLLARLPSCPLLLILCSFPCSSVVSYLPLYELSAFATSFERTLSID